MHIIEFRIHAYIHTHIAIYDVCLPTPLGPKVSVARLVKMAAE